MSNTPETQGIIECLKITWDSKTSREHFCASKEAAIIGIENLETQRDEARAEVERLKTALSMFVTAEESFRRNAPTSYPLPGGDAIDDAYRAAKAVLGNPVMPTVATNDTQPEIFEAHGLEWYRYDGNGVRPCEPNLKLELIWADGTASITTVTAKSLTWFWSFKGKGGGDIIGWRPADAPEKLERK